MFDTIESIQDAMHTEQYIADRALATVVFLSLKLNKPLFLEGEPGVGKTEVANVLGEMLNTHLIRLQCYEGLDVHNAVYDWDYSRQILHLRILEASGSDRDVMERTLYSPDFLLSRPLLQAIDNSSETVPVLLIDEIDRADEEFESFLLEILSEYQISIPEIGTVKANHPPIVVITSNRTREVHDALKRRCIYHWIDYPNFEREYQILQLRLPALSQKLSRQIVSIAQRLRETDLYKPPGVAETLDWGRALLAMDQMTLDENLINDTLGVLLKYQDDIQRVRLHLLKDLTQRAEHA